MNKIFGKIGTVSLITLAAFGLFLYTVSEKTVEVKSSVSRMTCAMIGNYDQAQLDRQLYLADPQRYKQFKYLYVGKDGIVCKTLKNK